MATRITKTEMFNKIKAQLTDKEMIAFIDDQIALIARKNSAKKKPTKAQIENASIKETILASLSNEPMTITDLQATNDTLSDLSNQRVSALLTQLVADNKVARTSIKRKSYFSLV